MRSRQCFHSIITLKKPDVHTLGSQMDLCVQDIMSPDVVTVEASQTIKNAARSMAKFGISGLVVLHEGNLAGILTERDILMRVVTSGVNPESVRARRGL